MTEIVASNRSLASKLGRWTAELLLVFLGAYAAFWLNNYQQHQQDARRRDQILAAVEQNAKDEAEDALKGANQQDQLLAAFTRSMEAGEMPPLRTMAWSSSYSASDNAVLMQAGALDLLDVKTLTALRNVDVVMRSGLGRMAHYQQVSDALIQPNLDQEITFFYDPATKQLRKRFAIYPKALEAGASFLHELARAYDELLGQIRAERQRH